MPAALSMLMPGLLLVMLPSVTTTLSLPSTRVSSSTATSMSAVVSPARIVTVPEGGVVRRRSRCR